MNERNKKIIGMLAILALLVAACIFMFQVPKADAATLCPYGTNLNSATHHSYCYTFYTSNYKVYQLLTERFGKYINVDIIYTGQPVPAPDPCPQPNPSPDPKPNPDPAPTPNPDPAPSNGLTAAEQRMFDLINQDRVAAGLAPLEIDMRLVRAARIKSQDMQDKGYFAHTAPDGTTPWDLMKAQGVTYRAAGENIAKGYPDSDIAEKGFMYSPGHRANILNKNYTHVGIGIVGNYYTQEFAGF